ncbi:TPA: hypothetical protein ACH3X1_010956 [Trebouxia sp. C0004]
MESAILLGCVTVRVIQGLYFARLDTSWVIARSPQLLQASFAAITDIFVYKLARLHFGQRAARWTLLCQLINWFNAYCLVRTYSNSFEALCTVTGVHCWCLSLKHQKPETTQPQHDGPHHPQKVPEAAEHQPLQPLTGLTEGASKQSGCPFKVRCLSSAVSSDSVGPPVLSHRQAWLLAAAVGVLFRPSSMLFWLPLGMYKMRSSKSRSLFVLEAAVIGVAIMSFGALVDRAAYGRWVLVPWEFLKFNLFQGGSAMYGSHPWHWNFTQGFPTITVTFLPLSMWGVHLSPHRLELAALVLWSLLMYSLPAHKEFRFLLPALCLLMPYCGVALEDLANRFKEQCLAEEGLVFQALLEAARNSCVQSKAKIHASKLDFPLDRSAVAIARELSKKLDEAPQEGGCPFMISAKTQLAEPASAKVQHHICPVSSSHAAQSRSQAAQTDVTKQAKICPFSGAKLELTDCQSQIAAAAAGADSRMGSRCSVNLPGESSLSPSSALGSSPDAASCPFNYGNKENIPSQIQPVGSAAASDEAEAAVDEPMTEDALREYEQAFSMEPDEAMLQAYATLLADKVAEADMEADDTPAAAATASQGTQAGNGCPKILCTNAQTDTQMSGKDAKAMSSGTDISRPASHTHSLAEESAEEKTNGWAELAGSDRTGQIEPATCLQSWTAVTNSLWLELLQQPPRWHAVMAACFGVQVAMTLYFSLVHQRGQIDVMRYLAEEAKLQPSMHVLFLTPCHATPYYSHVHYNITMDFLDCSPPGWSQATQCLNDPGCALSQIGGDTTADTNEWSKFKAAPLHFLIERWETVDECDTPTHLVMFSDLVPALSRYVGGHGFSLHKTFFNCHFEVDAGSSIWVWKQRNNYL